MILDKEPFLNCSWRFLRFDTLEHFKLKLEFLGGIYKPAEKSLKIMLLKK